MQCRASLRAARVGEFVGAIAATLSRRGVFGGLRRSAGAENGRAMKCMRPSTTRPRMDAAMRTIRSLFSLTPHQLLTETRQLLVVRSANTADLLEHLAEIDSRSLHVEAAYGSTQAFCVGELGLNPDSAEKWIQAARAVRRVPALLAAVADGRLHLSAVVLLAPHADADNADEMIAFASTHSCADIRAWNAARAQHASATPDLLAQVVANHQSEPDSNPVMSSPRDDEVSVAPVASAPPPPAPRVLTFTVPAELADAYRAALALAPYEVARDPARAFAHMLAAWRAQLEKRRCAATSRPARRRSAGEGRSVPAEVKREVWERDGGQCTYVSDKGRRCERRHQLELDHVTPIARGGRSTADNLRLRCRAHNQLEAERTFGAGFVAAKREAARKAREREQAQRAEECAAEQARRTREREADAARHAAAAEVEPYLRRLGLGAREARDLASRVSASPEQSLEERVRAALRTLGSCGTRVPAPSASCTT